MPSNLVLGQVVKSCTTTMDMYLQRWQCNLQHKLNGESLAVGTVALSLQCTALCCHYRMTLQYIMQRTAHVNYIANQISVQTWQVNLSCLYRDLVGYVAYTLWCMWQAFNCVSIFCHESLYTTCKASAVNTWWGIHLYVYHSKNILFTLSTLCVMWIAAWQWCQVDNSCPGVPLLQLE